MKGFFNISKWTLPTPFIFLTTWAFAENLQLQPPSSSPALGADAPLTLEDIQGPISIVDPVNWWIYIAIACVVTLLVASSWWLIKKRKKVVPLPSATKIALQQMDDISDLQKEAPLLYVAKISIITREYIARRFAISSSKTTKQFFQSLGKSNQMPQEFDQEFFTKFFNLFDTAKFAHRKPRPEEVKNIEQALRNFIHKGGDNALS